MTRGSRAQLQPLLQLAERQLGVGARVAARGEAGGGVLAAPARPACARSPRCGTQHLDLLLAPAGSAARRSRQPLGLERRVLDLDRQQHLVGRRRAQVVVEADERREQLGVGELLPGEREARGCPISLPSRIDITTISSAIPSRWKPTTSWSTKSPTPPAAPPASPPARGSDRGSRPRPRTRCAPPRPSCAPRSRSSSSSLLPSRNRRTSRTCSPYSSRDTGSTQGAGQRLIWYCRQGRRRLCST